MQWKIRWGRVLVLNAALTLLLGLYVFGSTPIETCIDDLDELRPMFQARIDKGELDPLHLQMFFDKQKNQWCYLEAGD